MTRSIVPLLLLAACGGAVTGVPPARRAPLAVTPSPSLATTAFVDAEPLELDTGPRCRWHGRVRVPDTDDVRLCLEPDRYCYATARQDVDAWLSVGTEGDPIALVEFENWGMSLGSLMALHSIELHMQAARTFSQYFVPFDARVAPRGTWRDVEATLDVGTGVLKPKTTLLSCDEVGLDGPMLGVAPEDSSGEQAAFTAERVPLSAEPGGPVVLEIARDAVTYDYLQWIRQQGRFTQISLRLASGYVQGWVPGSAIGPYIPPDTTGANIGHGASGGCANVWMNYKVPSGAACAKAVPLFVRVDGHTARVGQIFEGTRVRFGARHDDVVHVELPRPLYRNCRNEETERPDVSLLPGAELFVRERDARDCH